jgi:hypothetical protein
MMNDIQHINPIPLGQGGVFGIVRLKFPNLGPFTHNVAGDYIDDLGIAWADPADHTKKLSLAQGFDFASGRHYQNLLEALEGPPLGQGIGSMVSFGERNSSGGNGQYTLHFFIVDAAGVDLYECSPGITLPAASAVGNGVRGELHTSIFGGSTPGTLTIAIPAVLQYAR